MENGGLNMAKKTKNEENLPSKADVVKYVMLYDLLETAYVEMKDFSKKNPDTMLNERKVKYINKVLKDIKSILGNEASAEYLEIFNEDEEFPTYSDVVLTMSQYRSSMDYFRLNYRVFAHTEWCWKTNEGFVSAREIEGDKRWRNI